MSPASLRWAQTVLAALAAAAMAAVLLLRDMPSAAPRPSRRRTKERDQVVFVKTLSGETIVVEMGRGDTTDRVRAAIQETQGIAAGDQRLTYGGRDVGDGATLAECEIPRGATLHLSLRLRGGVPWGRLLMCAQAFQMVWPTVREWIRGWWNGCNAEDSCCPCACCKEENQCPPRCARLFPEPTSEDEYDDEDPPEPETGAPMRGNVDLATWNDLKPQMMTWIADVRFRTCSPPPFSQTHTVYLSAQHAEGVESGKVTEPLKTREEVRYTRSIFNGESILPKDLPKEEQEKEP